MKRVFLNSALLLALASASLQARAPTAPSPQQTVPLAPGAKPAGFEGSAYRKAAEIPARIMSFTAEPGSIRPGQPAVLDWSTENPSGVTIEPGIGRVLASGSKQITPARTTTYTLTVRGPNDAVLTRTVTVNVVGTTPLPADAPVESRQVPRLNGKLDFSGVYSPAGGRNARGGNSEQPVLKAGAEKYRVVRGPNDTTPLVLTKRRRFRATCIPTPCTSSSGSAGLRSTPSSTTSLQKIRTFARNRGRSIGLSRSAPMKRRSANLSARTIVTTGRSSENRSVFAFAS